LLLGFSASFSTVFSIFSSDSLLELSDSKTATSSFSFMIATFQVLVSTSLATSFGISIFFTSLEINFFVIFLSQVFISKENSSVCKFSIEICAIQFLNFKILENFAVFEVDEISRSEAVL
jgi:hypothetical protein